MKLLQSSLIKKILVILGAYAFIIFWLFLIKIGLNKLITLNFFTGIKYTALGTFFFGCILAPLWEELVFRHAPLLIAKKFKKKLKIDFTWPIVIISSVIFGWGHGFGPISILIQGVGGLILSFVYLKNNNSYWSAVATHFLWNFSLIYVFPSFISEYGIRVIW